MWESRRAAMSVERQFRMKDKYDQRRENATQNQVLLDRVERVGDELRLITRVA